MIPSLLRRILVGLPLLVALVASAANAGAPPKSVDLRAQFRRFSLEPRKQGKRNTCSVFVTSGALSFALSKQQNRSRVLSVEFLNWACNQEIGNATEDRGQFFHDLLRAYEKYGVCYDADMPYRPVFSPKYEPSQQALRRATEVREAGLRIHWIAPWKPRLGIDEETLQRAKAVLASGYPVAAGSNHSLLLVGYADDPRVSGAGTFLTMDSGPGSFGTISYQFARTNLVDLFWVEEAPEPAAR